MFGTMTGVVLETGWPYGGTGTPQATGTLLVSVQRTREAPKMEEAEASFSVFI